MSKTVPFQIIQFSISMQFKSKYSLSRKFLFQAIQFSQIIQFNLSMPLVLFNPLIEPYQVLPRRIRVDLGAMAMKRSSYSPKPQHYWNLTIRLFSVISMTLMEGGGSYPMPAGQWKVRINSPVSVLGMTLNNLRVRLHSWNFGKCQEL